ncbi:MAG: hypothetical protein HYZ53_15870 [Planctomycetes bacterium]|nr:hypothetical protein [Planctomycetota bacterium]
MLRACVVVLGFVSALSGCATTSAQPAVNLRWKFAVGDKQVYRWEMRKQIRDRMTGDVSKDLETQDSLGMDYTLEVLAWDGMHATIEKTINRIWFSRREGPIVLVDFDTDRNGAKASLDPKFAEFASLRDFVVHYSVDERNQVASLQYVHGTPPTGRDTPSAENLVRASFQNYPDHPMRVGERWESDQSVAFGDLAEISLGLVHRLDRVERLDGRQVARVVRTGKAKWKRPPSIGEIALRGFSTSTERFDIDEGASLECHEQTDLEFHAQSEAREWTQTQTIHVDNRRLDRGPATSAEGRGEAAPAPKPLAVPTPYAIPADSAAATVTEAIRAALHASQVQLELKIEVRNDGKSDPVSQRTAHLTYIPPDVQTVVQLQPGREVSGMAKVGPWAVEFENKELKGHVVSADTLNLPAGSIYFAPEGRLNGAQNLRFLRQDSQAGIHCKVFGWDLADGTVGTRRSVEVWIGMEDGLLHFYRETEMGIPSGSAGAALCCSFGSIHVKGDVEPLDIPEIAYISLVRKLAETGDTKRAHGLATMGKRRYPESKELVELAR